MVLQRRSRARRVDRPGHHPSGPDEDEGTTQGDATGLRRFVLRHGPKEDDKGLPERTKNHPLHPQTTLVLKVLSPLSF